MCAWLGATSVPTVPILEGAAVFVVAVSAGAFVAIAGILVISAGAIDEDSMPWLIGFSSAAWSGTVGWIFQRHLRRYVETHSQAARTDGLPLDHVSEESSTGKPQRAASKRRGKSA